LHGDRSDDSSYKTMRAIVDNYATDKHPKARQRLARHRRWTFRFTPASASWLNAVERLFAALTKRRLKRETASVADDLHADFDRLRLQARGRPVFDRLQRELGVNLG
jgi:transposase